MAAIELQRADTSWLELRRSDGRIHSWIRRGLTGPADVRGPFTEILGLAGLTSEAKVKERRLIDLGQFVKGSGATLVAAQQDYLSLQETLRAAYEETQGNPRAMRVHAPLYGIASGYWTLNVEWLNTIEQDPIAGFQQLTTARFICIDSPPDWTAVP